MVNIATVYRDFSVLLAMSLKTKGREILHDDVWPRFALRFMVNIGRFSDSIGPKSRDLLKSRERRGFPCVI